MTDSQKLDMILAELSGVKTDVSDLKTDVSALKTDVSDLKTDVSDLKTDVSALKTDVSSIKTRLDNVEAQTQKTNLILENEIRVNIQRIAEGHLDLSRNLHDAMRPSNEVEMLAIKVRMLETEIRDIKQKLA